MFSKLTFGQKLAVWLGCALAIVIASIVAISIQMAKNPPKDVEQFINNELFGRKFYTDEDWANEEREASAELEKNSKSAYWYARRASARWSLSNYEGSEADYTRAIELDPTDANSLASRAALRGYDEKYKEALADATKAISINPKDGWPYMIRADIYRRMGKFEEALKDTDKCLETDSDKRDAYSTRAEIYKKMHRYDKSIEAYEEAITYRKPRRSDNCFDELVQLYIITGRLKEAQTACRKWIVDNQPPEDAYRFYANVSKALRDKESEEEAYKKYLAFISQKIANAPTETDNYATRGSIYDKISEPEKARFDYLDFLEGSDLSGLTAPRKILQAGKLFDRVGQSEKKTELYHSAIERCTQELKTSPNDARLYSCRAQLFAAQDNPKAAKDFETADKLEHSTAATLAYAEFALKTKQYDLAIKLATEIADYDEATAYAFQSAVFNAMGKRKMALRFASEALEKDPFLPAAYYWLSKARAASGETAEAARKLKQATAFGYDPKVSMFEKEDYKDEGQED